MLQELGERKSHGMKWGSVHQHSYYNTFIKKRNQCLIFIDDEMPYKTLASRVTWWLQKQNTRSMK